MLALYILAGTGLVVWLWLVWDMTREARARRALQPSAPKGGATAQAVAGPEAPAQGAKPGQKPKAERPPRPKRPKGAPPPKIQMRRHPRKPPAPPPEPEAEPQPPPKPARDPREWTDEDYD